MTDSDGLEDGPVLKSVDGTRVGDSDGSLASESGLEHAIFMKLSAKGST